MGRGYEIRACQLTARHTAVVRGELSPAELPGWRAGVYRTVFTYLHHTGTAPAGPPFARLTHIRGLVAVEAGFPVLDDLDELDKIDRGGPVQASMLPAGPAAVTTHTGDHRDLDAAYRAVRDWLDARSHRPAGPPWQTYLTDASSQPEPTRWRTEIVVPYRAR